MRAALLQHRNGVFDVVDDLTVAAPIGSEVLVEVQASGLCHSDLHYAENDFGTPLPAVYGHELAGVVAEVGPDVTEFAPGDHVVGTMLQYCRRCGACLAGRPFQCGDRAAASRSAGQEPRLSRNGAPVHPMFGTGAFAERALLHESQLAPVPKEMPFPQAAIMGCSTATGVGAVVNTAGVRPGETVVVVGVGGVGLNVVSGARLAGAARIVAVDVRPEKLDLARRFGATDVVDASTTDPVMRVREVVDGGVDHAFEVVGSAATSLQALEMARVGGAAFLIGAHLPGATITLDPLAGLIATQKRLQGVYMGSTSAKRDIPRYAELYLDGRLNLDDLVSGETSLDRINDAYDDVRHGRVARTVITAF